MQSYEDYLLYPILEGATLAPKSKKPYLVFTPFKNYCLTNNKVDKPDPFIFKPQHIQTFPALESIKCHIKPETMYQFYNLNKDIRVNGGRKKGLAILANITKFKSYNKDRNSPAIPTTTLSAYLHFTPVSIR